VILVRNRSLCAACSLHYESIISKPIGTTAWLVGRTSMFQMERENWYIIHRIQSSLLIQRDKMFNINLSYLAVALLSLTQSWGVTAIPAPYVNGTSRDILPRAIPAPPYFAAYSDKWVSPGSPPAPSAITGFNVL
jgi:hypothetical protein